MNKDKKNKLRKLLAKISPEDRQDIRLDELKDTVKEIAGTIPEQKDYSKSILILRDALLALESNFNAKIMNLSIQEPVENVREEYLKGFQALQDKLDTISNDFSNESTSIEKKYTSLNNEISESVEKLTADFDEAQKAFLRFRTEMINRGGGGAHRQILVNGVDVLTKYTDINFTGVTATVDNTHGYVTFAIAGGVSSVTNIDGSLIISPTVGGVIASLNVNHYNIWNQRQDFLQLATFSSDLQWTPVDATSQYFQIVGDSLGNTAALMYWDAFQSNFMGWRAPTAFVTSEFYTFPPEDIVSLNGDPVFWVSDGAGGGVTSFIDLLARANTWTGDTAFEPTNAGAVVEIRCNTNTHARTGIRFWDNGNTHYMDVRAPKNYNSANFVFELPPDMGTSGYVLSTDGSGNSSWVPAGGSVTLGISEVGFGDISTGAITSDPNFLYDNSASTFQFLTNGTNLVGITGDDATNVVRIVGTYNGGGNHAFVKTDFTNGLTILGDVDGGENGVTFTVDDPNDQYIFNAFNTGGSGPAVATMSDTGVLGIQYFAVRLATNEVLGTSGSISSLCSTTPGTDMMLTISGYVNIISVGASPSLQLQVSFMDKNSVSRTITLIPQGLTSGVLATVGYYPFPDITISALNSNSVKIKTVVSGSVSYDVGGVISRKS